MTQIVAVLQLAMESASITAAIIMMMMLIEYANVRTEGAWMKLLGRSRWRQYGLAALLGASPGCFGAYVVVALYVDRRVSLGALVAATIATSGDESLVMLAMFPGPALLLMAGLALLGVLVGWVVDRLPWLGSDRVQPECGGFALHEGDREEPCDCCTGPDIIYDAWRHPSTQRLLLVGFGLVVVGLVSTGVLGPETWSWEWVLLLGITVGSLVISAITPEHFVREHLWGHVVNEHAPRILAWTFGVFLVVWGAKEVLPLPELVGRNPVTTYVIASLVGLIPESGPHLVFVKFFADGLVPLSVLVASSIVQDGHGMLPLLAHSRKDFVKIKAINLVVGLLVGGVMLAVGW